MPFDFAEKKRKRSDDEVQRIYVCECGDVCVETKYSRQNFSPEEFIGVLRAIVMKDKRRTLPTIQKVGGIKRICALVLSLACLFLMAACAPQNSTKTLSDADRIISIGGSATEIIYDLGAGAQLVGTDTSSIYPEAATKLPQVGYQRTLAAEGVLSLKPTLVVVLPEAGPPAAIEQIESAGVQVLRINNESSPEGTKAKIRQLAQILNRQEKGEELVKKLENQLDEANKLVAAKTTRPKVMFIYSRGSGAAQVGGAATPAAAMIGLAGGVNAVNGFLEYKPLTPEALVAAQPDVILLPARGLASLGGTEAVLNLPGVMDTPAGKNKRIVALDDMLLLGFTPRLGIGVKELCEKIH